MAKLLGFVLTSALLFTIGCGNESGVTAATPTPTPSPTPTPVTSNWALTPTPATQQVCNASAVPVGETFGSTTIPIDMSGGNFIPGWGFPSGDAVSDPPHGTLTGSNFTATWTWCRFDGVLTTRHVWNWTGTLDGPQTSFTSTISEVLTNANGDLRTTCATAVSGPMNDCTSPGLSWSLAGAKQ